MKRLQFQLLLTTSGLFAIQLAAPIVSLFYCILATPEQQTTLMTGSVVIWFICLVCMVATTKFLLRSFETDRDKLETEGDLPDSELLSLPERNSRLPIQVTVAYCFFFAAATLGQYLFFLHMDTGPASAFSLWGGGIAGGLTCPMIVFGAASLLVSPSTTMISDHVVRRGLNPRIFRVGIFPRLMICFVSIAVGLSIWLGFSAYYSGVNLTIGEMKLSEQRLVDAAVRHTKSLEGIEGDERLKMELEGVLKDASFFISDKSGRLLHSSRGESIDTKRWSAFSESMRTDFQTGRAGALYENVNERVIAWSPVADNRIVGVFSHLSDRYSRFSGFFLGSALFLFVGLFVGVSMGITNALAVAQSVQKASTALQDLSEGEGDLTGRLAVSSYDEVGELASGFNQFSVKLNAILSEIVENSKILEKTSNHFTDISKNIKESVGVLRHTTALSADQASRSSGDLEAVSSDCDLAANAANQVAAAAEEMSISVKEVAENADKARGITQQAVGTAKDTSAKISSLGESSKKIDTITEVITEISEQTNLLALNATIEAARAGEAGKGFNVVAGEIKDLSRQTAKATTEIRQQIEDIQRSTEEAILSMEEIVSVNGSVEEIVYMIAGAVEEQSTVTAEIAKNIAQVSSNIDGINKKVAESASISNNIANQLEDVRKKTDETAEDVTQVENGANDISHISNELFSQTAKFKI